MVERIAPVLLELAARFGRKVSPCCDFDANVCSWTADPAEPWKLVPLSGAPFSHELRLTYRKRRVLFFGNIEYLKIEVKDDFAAGILSVNRKEERLGIPSTLAATRRIGTRDYPIFTQGGRISPAQAAMLDRAEFIALVEQADPGHRESINCSNSEIAAYLLSPSLSRTMAVTERAIDLTEQVQVHPPQLDLDRLPPQFHPLIPLIEKWGISDDAERDDALKNVPDRALRTLVDEVTPYLDAIDAYLDSFQVEGPHEEAAALGRLAECALEAKLLLDSTQTR